jgi:hypothetical protein
MVYGGGEKRRRRLSGGYLIQCLIPLSTLSGYF